MWWMSQRLVVARAIAIHRVAHLIMGAKVLLKSIPWRYSKPLTTNHTFLIDGWPRRPGLSLKTHLQVMARLPRGKGSKSHF